MKTATLPPSTRQPVLDPDETPDAPMNEPQSTAVDSSYDPRATLPFSGDTVVQATARYPEEQAASVRALFYHCIEEKLRLQEVCKVLKRDYTTITRVMTGKYVYQDGCQVPLDNIIADIDAYLERFKAGALLRESFPFVLTPGMGQEIWDVADFVAETHTIGCIWGEPQTGKTAALKGYWRAHNHGRTKFRRIPPGAAPVILSREIAIACGVSPKTSADKLLWRIVRALDKSHLLILDEIHQLITTYHGKSRVKCFELIRFIRDESGCGVLLCGTNTARDEIMSGPDSKLLEQLVKRSPAIYQCASEITPHDLDALIAGWSLPPIPRARNTRQPDAGILRVAQHEGMETFLTFIKCGQRLASKAGRPFTWDDFITSHSVIKAMKGSH